MLTYSYEEKKSGQPSGAVWVENKLFNFPAIFVPVLFCQIVQIWSLFLSMLVASKYLPEYLLPNFENRVVKGSLRVGLILTVLPLN